MNEPAEPRWTIRIARPDDLPAMVRLQVETWRAEYAGWLDGDFVDGDLSSIVASDLAACSSIPTHFVAR